MNPTQWVELELPGACSLSEREDKFKHDSHTSAHQSKRGGTKHLKVEAGEGDLGVQKGLQEKGSWEKVTLRQMSG